MNVCSEGISCLKNTELFKSLGDTELQELSVRLKERVYPPNTAIVREGSSGDSMFIIKNGKVDVKKREPSSAESLSKPNQEELTCIER